MSDADENELMLFDGVRIVAERSRVLLCLIRDRTVWVHRSQLREGSDIPRLRRRGAVGHSEVARRGSRTCSERRRYPGRMSTWRQSARRLASGLASPLLARLAVGPVFVVSGRGKLHALDQVIDYFRKLGYPAPELQAPFVAGVEFVCGALLVVGLAARFAAALLVATMLVALATAIRPDVTGWIDLLGRVEVLYVVILLWIVVAGPGAVSLDAVAALRRGSDAERG